MTLLLNSFEGGTSGTTISTGNSGGASGNAFDFVSSAGVVNAFDNTHAAHGTLSGKLATTTSGATYWQWATSGSAPLVAQAWFRLYAYFTSNPANGHRLWNAANGAGSVMSVTVNTTGKLGVTYSSSGTAFITFTTAVGLNAWFRVEGFVIASATVGQVSLSLYNTMDSATATESHTSAANLDVASADPTSYNFGCSTSVASVGPFWMDDIGLSSTGAIGPVPSSGSRARTPASLPSLITTL